MLKQVVTIIRVKLFFATVNKYRGWKAKRKLAAYVKTLSPEKQAWANDLQKRLERQPKSAVKILRAETDQLFEKHARLAEQLNAVTIVTNSDARTSTNS